MTFKDNFYLNIIFLKKLLKICDLSLPNIKSLRFYVNKHYREKSYLSKEVEDNLGKAIR